jgi:periplasmic protein TonB
MSTQTAVQRHIVIPTMAKFVDSLSDRAAAAVKLLDDRLPSAAPASLANEKPSAEPTMWAEPASFAPSSRISRGGVLLAVAVIHVVAGYAMVAFAPNTQKKITVPLQVVTIKAPESVQDIPPPPVPRSQPLEIYVPEPAVNVAIDVPAAITVAPTPVEPAASTTPVATGTPKVVSSVEYIREPAARYPPAARALKQRGIVMLRALIDTAGRAAEVNVHRSSGYRILDDAARTAVLNALFKPYAENGQFQPVYVLIPIEFGAG